MSCRGLVFSSYAKVYCNHGRFMFRDGEEEAAGNCLRKPNTTVQKARQIQVRSTVPGTLPRTSRNRMTVTDKEEKPEDAVIITVSDLVSQQVATGSTSGKTFC